MAIVTLIRNADGLPFRGFLDWDKITPGQMNFYYYDETKRGWISDKLGGFRTEPLPRTAYAAPTMVCESGEGGGQ